MIQLGPNARVWVLVKVDGHWRRLVEGRQASVMRLKDDQAVLLVLMHERYHGELFFMKEGDAALIPIKRFFPEGGHAERSSFWCPFGLGPGERR
jgi:hypothetical protein